MRYSFSGKLFFLILAVLIFSNFSTQEDSGKEYVFLKDGRVFEGPIMASSVLFSENATHYPMAMIYQIPPFEIILLENIASINFIEKKSHEEEDKRLISDDLLTVISKDGNHFYAECFFIDGKDREVYIFQTEVEPKREKKMDLARIYFPKLIQYSLKKRSDGSIEFILKKSAKPEEVSEVITEKKRNQLDVGIEEIEKTEDHKSVIAQCIEKLGGGVNIKPEEIKIAKETLEWYGDLAIDPLLEVFENKDNQDAQNPARRLNALAVLGEIGNKRAVEPLKKLLESEALQGPEKELANKSINKLESIKILFQRAKYSPEGVVIFAFGPRFIEYLNYKKSIESLRQALKSYNWLFRLDGLATLLHRKERMDVETIIDLLKDKHKEIRLNSTAVLAVYKDKSSFDYLIEALKDEDWGVRDNAVKALEAIGDPRAIEHIKKLENDPEKYVRESANKALKILKKRQ